MTKADYLERREALLRLLRIWHRCRTPAAHLRSLQRSLAQLRQPRKAPRRTGRVPSRHKADLGPSQRLGAGTIVL
jgi:hypothetical protein